MENYIKQLLADISQATENVEFPFADSEMSIHDWISDDEENQIAPVRELEEWTGIRQENLPSGCKL